MLLISTIVALAVGVADQNAATAPTVLGLRLGTSTIGDAIYVLGPPVSVSLADEDNPRPDNAIVLRYEKPFPLTGSDPVGILVVAQPPTYVVTHVQVQLVGSPGLTVQRLTDTFGSPRVFRLKLACPDSDESCGEFCAAKDGQLRVLVFRDQALAAHGYLEPDSSITVQLLDFSFDVWRSGLSYPRCKSGA